MKNCLVLALAALALSSCSLGEKFSRLKAEDGMTIVQFAKARSLAAAPPRLAGGVMVYALRRDGYGAAFKLQDETDDHEVSLPNGEYTFRAVGWAGANLTGATQCGLGRPAGGAPGGAFRLTGVSTNVAIAMSPAACDSDAFASAALRTGSSFLSPSLIFCSEDTSIAGRSASALCTGGDESIRFLKGISATSAAKIEDVEYFAAKDRFVFSADLHDQGRVELFSVDGRGRNLIRQNHKIGSSTNQVKKMAAVPGTDFIIYLATEPVTGVDHLYVSEVGKPGVQRLLSTAPQTGVKTFQVTKHGTHIVFVADLGGTANNFGLYSLPLTAATLAGLNPPGSIRNLSSSKTLKPDGVDYVYAVSANDTGAGIPQVLFATNDAQNEVYVSSLDASLLALKLTTSTTNTSANISQVFFLGETAAMGFIGNITGPRKAYYSVLGPANLVVPPVVISELDADSVFSVSPYSPSVVYSRDADSKSKLFSLTVDLSTFPPTSGEIVLSETPTLNATYGGIQFHPDGQRLTFWANGEDTTKHEVYSGRLNQTAVLRGHSSPGISLSSFSDPEKLVQFGGPEELFYLSSSIATPALGDIYRVDTASASSRNAVRVSTNEAGDVTQMALRAFPGHAFYTKLVPGTDPFYELHHYNAGTTDSRTISLPGVQSITKLHGAPAEWPAISAAPAPLFFEARSTGSTGGPADLFVIEDRNAAIPRFRKLTHLFDSPDGYGRFRFTMIPYRRAAGGNLVPSGEGISSGCLGIPNRSNDSPVPLPISFPFGNGPSPFAVVLELFPEQLNCDGPALRYQLDAGLNMLTNATAASKAALSVGPPPEGARLFLRD